MDNRTDEGKPVNRDLSERHGAVYLQPAEQETQGDTVVTFTHGPGIVKF